MPVAATTQQANADARSEAKAFAKENVHGLQPSSHGFTTLMLALFAILTDVTDDFVPQRMQSTWLHSKPPVMPFALVTSLRTLGIPQSGPTTPTF